MNEKRVATQIAMTPDCDDDPVLVALASDGTLWRITFWGVLEGREWDQIPPLPQPEDSGEG